MSSDQVTTSQLLGCSPQLQFDGEVREEILCVPVSILSSECEPLHGFFGILLHSLSSLKEDSKVVLSASVSILSRPGVPLHRFLPALISAVLFEASSQIELS